MRRGKIKKKGIVTVTIYILVILLLTTYLISLITTGNNLLGYTARIVASGSMEPTIKVNSINIIKLCGIDDIKEGDIICFNYYQDIIHRVINKTTNDNGIDIVHTKGDANEFADSIEVNGDMILGKVIYTENRLSKLINKYSIRPGEIDSATLSKDIIILCIILCIVLWTLDMIRNLLAILIKAFIKKDNLKSSMQIYLDDIDELVIHREIIKELIERKEEHKGIKYLLHKLTRYRVELELRRLHSDIKHFRKDIKRRVFRDTLFRNMLKGLKRGKVPKNRPKDDKN